MEHFEKVDYRTAVDFLLPRHYSGRVPSISYAYGLYDERGLMAVCTFGSPASPSLCKGVAGEKYRHRILELNRLCREDEYGGVLSHFVAWCLKQLKPLNVIVVSYSDTDMNHHGYIYQACNFLYTGMTKKRTDKYTEGNKHSRHYDNDKQNGLRKVRSAKYRYIYLCGDRRSKKDMLSHLNYPILGEYPKGDNSNYILGEYQKPKIIKTKESDTIGKA